MKNLHFYLVNVHAQPIRKRNPPATENSHGLFQRYHPTKNQVNFMSAINALKRMKNISLPWESSTPLPPPIISYNLPKSATLTTKTFFKCGGIASSHTYVPMSDNRIGDCMRENFITSSDPFKGCDYIPSLNQTIEFYSDIGVQVRTCWYNSLHDGGLEHVAKFYPNATIFMLPRNASSWYQSVRKWGDGRILNAWRINCGFSGAIGDNTQADWESFYHAHTEKIRQFALRNLHITYVEVELGSKDWQQKVEYYPGIDKSCLKHCYPGPPKDPNVDLRTYQRCKSINATL